MYKTLIPRLGNEISRSTLLRPLLLQHSAQDSIGIMHERGRQHSEAYYISSMIYKNWILDY